MRTPDVVIVGAQKAATTGLLQTLAQHPGIVTTRVQEATTLHAGPADWPQWVRNYEPRLEAAKADDVVLVKLATAMHFPDTLRTIRLLTPDARAIAVLRHPVNRMLSLHRYATQLGLESRSAEEAIRSDMVQRAQHWRLNTYSGGSRYASAIAALREVFEHDGVLFLDYADVSEPACLDRVQRFLFLPQVQLDPVRANETRSPRSGAVARAMNSAAARALGRGTVPARWRERVRGLANALNARADAVGSPSISAELRAELVRRHAPDVDAAERVLEKSLPEWRQ
jgi:hypothetical protein